MKKELRQAVAWTRPKLVKVGTIRDVAGGPTPISQTSNTKS